MIIHIHATHPTLTEACLRSIQTFWHVDDISCINIYAEYDKSLLTKYYYSATLQSKFKFVDYMSYIPQDPSEPYCQITDNCIFVHPIDTAVRLFEQYKKRYHMPLCLNDTYDGYPDRMVYNANVVKCPFSVLWTTCGFMRDSAFDINDVRCIVTPEQYVVQLVAVKEDLEMAYKSNKVINIDRYAFIETSTPYVEDVEYEWR